MTSSTLTVTEAVLEDHKAKFANARVIIIQHIISDTEKYLDLLEDFGADVFHVVCKPFSYDHEVLERVRSRYTVTLEPYSVLEATDLLDDILDLAEEASVKDGRQIVILDVGGYYAARLAAESEERSTLSGVVEVTTFGHKRYLEAAPDIRYPVFSVARSRIKEIEARFVALAASNAIDNVMRSIGTVLQGKRALVHGYGMIGSNVAEALRAKGMVVSVFDLDSFPMLRAATQGFAVGDKPSLLGEAEFIFSSTACVNALNEADFDSMADGAYLVSVGSRTNEFDVDALTEISKQSQPVADHIECFEYKGKYLNLVKKGQSINFLEGSCQDEVIDLLFAEISICASRVLGNKHDSVGSVHESKPGDIDTISNMYLKYRRGVNL